MGEFYYQYNLRLTKIKQNQKNFFGEIGKNVQNYTFKLKFVILEKQTKTYKIIVCGWDAVKSQKSYNVTKKRQLSSERRIQNEGCLFVFKRYLFLKVNLSKILFKCLNQPSTLCMAAELWAD